MQCLGNDQGRVIEYWLTQREIVGKMARQLDGSTVITVNIILEINYLDKNEQLKCF